MSDNDIVVLDCNLATNLGPLDGNDDLPSLGARVLITLALTPEKADELAAHKQERDLLSRATLAECNREVGDPTMQALVDSGYGKQR